MWKTIGLADTDFDIIVFSDPAVLERVPSICHRLPDDPMKDLDMTASLPGRCLFAPLVGIRSREPLYDGYMNSMECLYNEKAAFLIRYELLMRSDLDTFPTPHTVTWRPSRVFATVLPYGYTFKGATVIREKLVEAAKVIGITHRGWHDLASSWFGPSRDIMHLAELTVNVGLFLKYFMFGATFQCHLPADLRNPSIKCEWGKYLWEGVTLLYSQEMALNALWTDEDYKYALSLGWLMDSGTTSGQVCVCDVGHLHSYHSAEEFSKLAFHMGSYNTYDMSKLDLTIVRDYCMYMAIEGNKLGSHGDKPLAVLGSFKDLCSVKAKLNTVRRFRIRDPSGTKCLQAESDTSTNVLWTACDKATNAQLWWFSGSELWQTLSRCLRPLSFNTTAAPFGVLPCLTQGDPNYWLQCWEVHDSMYVLHHIRRTCLADTFSDTPHHIRLGKCIQSTAALSFLDERVDSASADAATAKAGKMLIRGPDGFCVMQSGAHLVSSVCSTTDVRQQWFKRPDGSFSRFTTQDQVSGLCMHLQPKLDGRYPVVMRPCLEGQSEQAFTLSDGKKIQSKHVPSICLSAAALGSPMQFTGCTERHTSPWEIVAASGYNPDVAPGLFGHSFPLKGVYLITQTKSRCLDRFGPTSIVSYGCQVGSINQLWGIVETHLITSIIKSDSGNYTVVNNCLTAQGSAVVMSLCDINDPNQRWKMSVTGVLRSLNSDAQCITSAANTVALGSCDAPTDAHTFRFEHGDKSVVEKLPGEA
jgi:hypothetical protein